MKQKIYHRKCFTKRLGGKWDWEVPVWVGEGTFADCVIKCRDGKVFDTREAAVSNLIDVLTKLKIV